MANKEKSGWVKWLVIVIIVGGAVAGAAWFFKRKGDPAPEFQTAKVTRGEITQAVTATGQLNPVLNVQVGSQISGIILKLNADFNTVVKAGDIVAELDAATYRANVSSAEGEVANAKASLELAQINARRAEELYADKLISRSEYDQATATLHQAEAQVKIRAAALERAKVDLGRCTIYAPVDGLVIDRKVDVGQTVAASMSAPVLFQIANDLTKMQIDANVAEADVGGVEVGQDVEFTVDAFPYRTFHGKVIQVRNSPLTVQNVVTYDTVIEVSNPDLKLKPGMTANVSIIVARRDGVLKVPNAVLRFRPPESALPKATTNAPAAALANAARPAVGSPGGGQRVEGEGRRGTGGGERGSRSRGESRAPRFLYTLSADPTNAPNAEAELKPVQVKLGITDGVMTEVVEGLNEGETVVISMTTATTNSPTANPFGMQGGFPRR